MKKTKFFANEDKNTFDKDTDNKADPTKNNEEFYDSDRSFDHDNCRRCFLMTISPVTLHLRLIFVTYVLYLLLMFDT